MTRENVKLDVKTLELGFLRIEKLLLRYSIPSVISMLVVALYNIVDRVYIGHGIGAMAISGLAITLPIGTLITAVGTLVGIGSSSRISIVLGKKDVEWARNILCHYPILMISFSSVFIVAALVYLDPLLVWFGGSENTIPYAKDYLKIVIPASIFTNLCFGFSHILRASGFPYKSMTAILIGVIINVILDPIFIFWLDMGIRGAAVATAISMFIGAAYSVSHFLNRKNIISFHWESFKLKKYIIRNIVSIGFSPFIMNLVAAGVVMIVNIQLGKYGGDLAVGAFGIINSYLLFIVLLVMGIGQGMQPIVGYNFGALKMKRVKDALFLTVRITTGLAVLFCILAEVAPELLTKAFTSDPDLLEIAVGGFRYVFSTMVFIGLPITLSTFFLSIGRPMKSILLSLCRQLIFLVPLLLILPRFFGTQGVWYSMMISDFASFCVATIFMIQELQILYKSDRKFIFTPYNIWKYLKING